MRMVDSWTEDRDFYERLLRNDVVINKISDGITVSDAKGHFEVFNARMREITGYTDEEANHAMDFNELIHPELKDRQEILKGLSEIAKEIIYRESEAAIRAKDGSEKTLLVSTSVIRYKNQDMFLSVWRDITERKLLQNALQDSETRFRRLFETAQDGILILDADTGQIREVNRFLIDMLGYSREEFLGRKLWEISAFIDDNKCKTAFKELQTKGYVRYEDLPLQAKDGSLINVEFVSNVYKVDQANVIQCNIRDITERKRLEEKLKTLASHDELTGCANFRSTIELLEKEIDRSQRFKKQFSIIMIDIDDFKKKNDEYGHQAGNDILVVFANVMKNSLRSIDSVGRYGGEEFIVILPETDAQQALVVSERIRNMLDKTRITSPHLDNGEEATLTFSAGIALFPNNAKDIKELIWVADNALLQAKREGKNRAVLEKRKSIRFSPKPGTRIEIVDPCGKENVGARRIADISKEGMLFFSARDVPGKDFLCRIYRPKDEFPFELACRVKHKGRSENELYRVGVNFSDIPESSKDKLSQCIEFPLGSAPKTDSR